MLISFIVGAGMVNFAKIFAMTSLLRKATVVIPVLMLFGCSALKETFLDEAQADINKHRVAAPDTLTAKALEGLPVPVRQYLKYCCYTGKPEIMNMMPIWKETYTRRAPGRRWKPAEVYQYNGATEPVRIMFLKRKTMGLLPYEARSKYQDGHSVVNTAVMSLFKKKEMKGIERDRSALAQVLSEALLVPGYALQPYIKWHMVDGKTVNADITWNGVTASGTFYFGRFGLLDSFVTYDRTYRGIAKTKWSVSMSDYVEKGNWEFGSVNECVKYPSSVKATWHLEGGDYNYFKGRISTIRFNLDTVSEAAILFCR